MRICRVCQQVDITGTFLGIFENNGQLVRMLNDLFGIYIIDYGKLPALICRKCESSIIKAHQLKLQILKSDEYYKVKTRDYEHYEWNDNLNILRRFQLTRKENMIELSMEKPDHDLDLQTSGNTNVNVDSDAKIVGSEREDFDETFQFLDEMVNVDNTRLLNQITEIANHSEQLEPLERQLIQNKVNGNVCETTVEFLDSVQLSMEQIKDLTDEIIAILPYQEPLTLRINLRNLRLPNRTKYSKKPHATKASGMRKKRKLSNLMSPSYANLAKLRPRRNSIF